MNQYNITNKDIGVNTGIINSCFDKIQLLEWSSKLSCHIAEINQQLEQYNANYQQGKEQIEGRDYDWFIRAKKYKKLQGVLHQQVTSRLSYLKKMGKSTHPGRMQTERNFWRDKLREIIDEDLFLVYCNEINSIIDQQIRSRTKTTP